MKSCIIIDRKCVAFMFISLITNSIKYTETAINNNNMESGSKSQRQNSSAPENYLQPNYDDVRTLPVFLP